MEWSICEIIICWFKKAINDIFNKSMNKMNNIILKN